MKRGKAEEFLLCFLTGRLSQDSRGHCAHEERRGNLEAIRMFQPSVDKISVLSFSRKQLLVQISFPEVKKKKTTNKSTGSFCQ